jgi:hypothetical protein
MLRVCSEPTFRVEVSDERPDLPVAAVPPAGDDGKDGVAGMASAEAEAGRGLLFLDTFAARWGCETDPTTKTVWFEL